MREHLIVVQASPPALGPQARRGCEKNVEGPSGRPGGASAGGDACATKLARVSGRRGIAGVTLVLGALLLVGCFEVPAPSPEPRPSPDAALSERVRTALDGREEDALAYAGLYAVLADRFEAGHYETTAEAAAVAGRAADILAVPGVLKEIVNDELNPLLGKPQPITPDLAAKAAATLRDLSSACREAAR